MADDPLLEPDEVRDRVPIGAKPLDAPRWDDDRIAAKVTRFEDLVLQYRGEVAATHAATETVRPVGVSDLLRLSWPRLTAITSITTAGGTVIDDDLYEIQRGFVRIKGGSWWGRYGCDLEVVYEHGFAGPEGLKDACALYVSKHAGLDKGGASRDMSAEGEFRSYIQPDMNAGRPTGWIDVDVELNTLTDYRMGLVR